MLPSFFQYPSPLHLGGMLGDSFIAKLGHSSSVTSCSLVFSGSIVSPLHGLMRCRIPQDGKIILLLFYMVFVPKKSSCFRLSNPPCQSALHFGLDCFNLHNKEISNVTNFPVVMSWLALTYDIDITYKLCKFKNRSK